MQHGGKAEATSSQELFLKNFFLFFVLVGRRNFRDSLFSPLHVPVTNADKKTV